MEKKKGFSLKQKRFRSISDKKCSFSLTFSFPRICFQYQKCDIFTIETTNKSTLVIFCNVYLKFFFFLNKTQSFDLIGQLIGFFCNFQWNGFLSKTFFLIVFTPMVNFWALLKSKENPIFKFQINNSRQVFPVPFLSLFENFILSNSINVDKNDWPVCHFKTLTNKIENLRSLQTKSLKMIKKSFVSY
jgi:hypothetical protein